MANMKDNLSKYGKAFIGFDEASGNAIDTINGYVGTLTNSPTRVEGWNGKGYAMSFNGTNQYVQFNSKVIPVGAKSIRLKLKITGGYPASGVSQNIINTLGEPNQKGFIIELFGDNFGIASANGDSTSWTNVTHSFIVQVPKTTLNLADNKWHDILFTWDGTLNPNSVKLFIDDMTNPIALSQAKNLETSYVNNLTLGKWAGAGNYSFFNGQLDSIEIYDRVISPIPDKYLIQHNGQYKYHDGSSWITTTPTETNFLLYGMENLDHIKEAQWKELVGSKVVAMWTDFEDKTDISVVLNIEETTYKDILGDEFDVLYYTQNDVDQIIVSEEVEPFSVYDYIGELPEVHVYTELPNDIEVATTVEPFEIYDEFGDTLDVLYYTDEETVDSANLIVTSNHSPLDDLGDEFDVVTWTDTEKETSWYDLQLDIGALPFGQLVIPKKAISTFGRVDGILLDERYKGFKGIMKTLVSFDDGVNWYTYDYEYARFLRVQPTIQNFLEYGMNKDQINNIPSEQLNAISRSEMLSIGYYIDEGYRDDLETIVEKTSLHKEAVDNTPTIKDMALYVLNTTASISIDFDNNVLKGQISDDDKTHLQYRILLNNIPYYPIDGTFTKLEGSPNDLHFNLDTSKINVGVENEIAVEFKDGWGTEDRWVAKFIGQYVGLIFKDPSGKAYSTDVGVVLQYLNLGTLIAGQTTTEYQIKIHNTFGYDIKNLTLEGNTNKEGINILLSKQKTPFEEKRKLEYGEQLLKTGEQFEFYLKVNTEFGTTPTNGVVFEVRAYGDRVEGATT